MPARADVDPAQQLLLDAAAEAAERRATAEQDFIQTVVDAAAAGVSLAEIGRTVGMSGDGIRKILTRRGYRAQAVWRPTTQPEGDPSMTTASSSVDQIYVTTSLDGTRILGGCRHTRDCTHLYPIGTDEDRNNRDARLAADPEDRRSFIREATPEEMATIRPCTSCGYVPERATLVTTCPVCHTVRSASGSCLCD